MRSGTSHKGLSLSARIRLLVMVTIFPAVFLVIYQAQASRMAALEATRDQTMLTLLSITTSQQKLLDDTRQFLQKLAMVPMAQALETPECSLYLAELLALTNRYVNLGIVRSDGELLCSAKPLLKSVNVADRPYFQRAIQEREFTIGAFQMDRAAQVTSVNFAFPVIEKNRQNVRGAAVAVVSLDWWSHRLADLGLPSGAVARVTDPRGIVIARYPPAPEQLGRLWGEFDPQTPSRSPAPGVLQRRNDQGERELVVFRPLLENTGEVVATMSLSMPLENIYGAANSRLWTDILVLLGGLLLSFLLAHEGIRRAVSLPLNRLMDATDQLAHGQYTLSMPPITSPELAELAHRFNTMALRRQSVEIQLRQSEENLALTLHSIGDAVLSTDTEGRISRMNEVAERLTGWPLCEAQGLPLGVVLKLVNTDTREPLPDPVKRALANGHAANPQQPTTLVARDAREYPIAYSVAPIRHASQAVVGVVLVFSDVSESERIKRLLQESEARFRALVTLSSDWFWEQDAEFRFIEVDNHLLVNSRLAYATILGTRRWDQPGLNLSEAQWDQHRAVLQQHQEFRDFEVQRSNNDGSSYWISISGTPIFNAMGQFCGYRGIGKDISKRKQVEEELRIAAIAFESQEGVLVTNEQFEILRSNRAFSRMTGYSAKEVLGQTLDILKSGRHEEAFFDTIRHQLHTIGDWKGEVWNRCKNGDVCLYYMTTTGVIHVDGRLRHYVTTLVDITQKEAAAKEIEHLAFYDALTQLPNRRLLMDRMQQAFAACLRNGRQGALLCLDLDHFKNLNDALGHDMGDVLLQQVAQRLKCCVREDDTVARFGGDEFLVLLEDLGTHAGDAAEQTQQMGEKILSALNQPYQLGSHTAHSTPSIGAVLFNSQTHNLDELVKYADLAMYAAKAEGRNTIRFFDPMMQAAVSARIALENDLRRALAEQQFQLYYQVQMKNGTTAIGAEALIRWQHPERGMVSPLQFIGLAEETGLILPMGLWVLQTACEQLRRWQHNPRTADLQLAVNVSARQFRQPNFTEQVCAVLQQTGARPDRLKLELTESMALDNVEDTIAKMTALRKLGLGFSLDDFGTGQSSLSYLTRLPLDQLKIDQSFVRNIGIQHTDALIVQTLIGMAHSLGINVIAEGVETEAQQAFLQQHGCTLCQGYLFSRPVPLDEFERLL